MSLYLVNGVSEEDLQKLYADPYIAKVWHDLRPAAPIYHDRVTYFGAYHGNTFLGAFMAVKANGYELELHSLLKRFALKHSRKLARMFIDCAFINHTILRITAYVIEGLEKAKNFCLKVGLKLEGIKRAACSQNGAIKDVYVFGMTRQEWEML